MVMSPEAKAALLKRLADGRSKTKAMRAEAKEKNLPDPKPRKARKSKKTEATDPKMAIPDPLSAATTRETLPPISGAAATDKNKVSAMPVDPEKNVTTKIDVPNLPSEKKLVEDAAEVPEAAPRKGISTTGNPEKYNDNDMLRSEETGNQAIEAQYPGQKESIAKVLKANKKENTPLAPKPEPSPPTTTVDKVTRHVPDIKAVEARQPFSFSAIRKVLYQ